MARKRRPAKSKTRLYARSKSARKAPRGRRGVVVLFLLVVAAAVLFGLYKGLMFAGSLFLSRNPNFEIKTVLIESDGRLSPLLLREYAGVSEGQNLFAVDFDEIREDLEKKVPLVKSVKIQRRLPDTLIIDVVERTAVAQIRWTPKGIPFLVDSEGVVLPTTRSGLSLPLIKGITLDALRPGNRVEDSSVQHCLAILAASARLGVGSQVQFDSFDLRYPEFITANLKNGSSARFPRHSARQKLVRLVSVLQLAKEQGRRVKTVDLTPDGRNVPVTYF